MKDEILHIAQLPPELDALGLSFITGDGTTGRSRISHWMKSGLIIGIVPGLYALAPELRKRPLSPEIIANWIYGPSYVSFEYVLSNAGLIPEAVYGVTSATPKRSRSVDTPLGRFSYRHLPLSAYTYGYIRKELGDGSGFLIARPEKALMDLMYRGGALRSVSALEARLFEDVRIDPDLFRELDMGLMAEYASRMPGDTFKKQFKKLIGRRYG